MPDLGKRTDEPAGQQHAASSGAPAAENDPMACLLARLEGLLEAYWLTAVAGDVKAAELVRRLLAQQAEMYGMRGKVAMPAADEGDDELAKLRARRASA